MVSVAQLVEPRIVIPVVVGSSPIVHPIFCGIAEVLQVELKLFLFDRAGHLDWPLEA